MTGEVTELTGEPASGKTQVTRHDIVTRPAAHIDTYLLEYLSLFPCMLHTHIDTSTPPFSSIYSICLSSPRPCMLHTHIDTYTPPFSSIYSICLSSPACCTLTLIPPLPPPRVSISSVSLPLGPAYCTLTLIPPPPLLEYLFHLSLFPCSILIFTRTLLTLLRHTVSSVTALQWLQCCTPALQCCGWTPVEGSVPRDSTQPSSGRVPLNRYIHVSFYAAELCSCTC